MAQIFSIFLDLQNMVKIKESRINKTLKKDEFVETKDPLVDEVKQAVE